MSTDQFIEAFNWVAKRAHDTALEKGWWEDNRSDGEIIALIHSELSEALEYLRKDPFEHDDKIGTFYGVEAELADVIIRIMDVAQARDWRVAEALIEKMVYNSNREPKHGKLF